MRTRRVLLAALAGLSVPAGPAVRPATATSPLGVWALDGPAMQAQAERIAQAMVARLRPRLEQIRARAAQMESQLTRLRTEAAKDPRKAALLPQLEAGLGSMRAMAADPEGYARAQAQAIAGGEGTVELTADGRAVMRRPAADAPPLEAEGRWSLRGTVLSLVVPGPGAAAGGPAELRLEGQLADDRIELRWLDPPASGDPATDALWRDYRIHLVRR
jgi:hypothetical protein